MIWQKEVLQAETHQFGVTIWRRRSVPGPSALDCSWLYSMLTLFDVPLAAQQTPWLEIDIHIDCGIP